MNCSHGLGCFILAAGDICPVCRTIVAAAPMRQATRGEVSDGVDAPVGHVEPPRELAPADEGVTSGHGTPLLPGHHIAASTGSVLGATTSPVLAVRSTDPDTSAEAAWNVGDCRDIYLAIMEILFEHGPQTDYHLSLKLPAKLKNVSDVLRTTAGKRRGELRDMELVCNSGFRAKTDTGSTAIRWALTPAGERALTNERVAV